MKKMRIRILGFITLSFLSSFLIASIQHQMTYDWLQKELKLMYTRPKKNRIEYEGTEGLLVHTKGLMTEKECASWIEPFIKRIKEVGGEVFQRCQENPHSHLSCRYFKLLLFYNCALNHQWVFSCDILYGKDHSHADHDTYDIVENDFNEQSMIKCRAELVKTIELIKTEWHLDGLCAEGEVRKFEELFTKLNQCYSDRVKSRLRKRLSWMYPNRKTLNGKVKNYLQGIAHMQLL